MVAIMDEQAGWLGVPTPEVADPDQDLSDGYTVQISGLSGTVLATPGHTPGSVCHYLPSHSLLLAGDTLFAGTVGRTDLPGGDFKTLIGSIRDRLLTLPEVTKVIPGHGSVTSIGQEKYENPFL
jgi:glyoxylase-like metal-dependent hydrolase (beta-lactamase superfamily II)